MSNLKVLRTCVILVSALCISSLSPAVNAAKAPKTKGAAGREGAAANTILSGRGVPKSALGVDGDFYIDISTYTIYGPKKNDKWPNGVNLKGPQGDAGKVGEKGSAGTAGAGSKGDKGERGEKGEKGDKGEPGVAGATGAPGASGPAGPAGAQGATGPAGAAGPQGATGPAGSNGAAGATGAKGDDGNPGVKGDTGDVGPAGPSNVSIVNVETFTIGSTNSIEYRSGFFGALEPSKKYSFEILVKGYVSGPSGLGKYFGSYVEGSEAGLVIQSSFTSASGYLVSRSLSAEDAYQFRWTGTVSGAINTAQLRLVLYHLNSSQTISALGTARFQEVGNVT